MNSSIDKLVILIAILILVGGTAFVIIGGGIVAGIANMMGVMPVETAASIGAITIMLLAIVVIVSAIGGLKG